MVAGWIDDRPQGGEETLPVGVLADQPLFTAHDTIHGADDRCRRGDLVEVGDDGNLVR